MKENGTISRRFIVAALTTTALISPVGAAIRRRGGRTFVSPSTPTVLSVSPNHGDIAGDTPVTVKGSNFAGTYAVTFGGEAATSVVVVNSTTITCVTPAHVGGAVNAAVTTLAGTGTGNHLYSYTSSPNPIRIAFIQSPKYKAASPAISIKMPNTYGVGTTIRRQVQVSGGDWSSPIRDITHTILSKEDEQESIAEPMVALSSGVYDWRVIVNGKQISNVIKGSV